MLVFDSFGQIGTWRRWKCDPKLSWYESMMGQDQLCKKFRKCHHLGPRYDFFTKKNQWFAIDPTVQHMRETIIKKSFEARIVQFVAVSWMKRKRRYIDCLFAFIWTNTHSSVTLGNSCPHCVPGMDLLPALLLPEVGPGPGVGVLLGDQLLVLPIEPSVLQSFAHPFL